MTRRKLALFTGVCALGVGMIYVLAANVIVARDWAFICENTGSRKGYRDWGTGTRDSEWYRRSELEAFMLEHYPSELEHRWTSYAATGKTLFGHAVTGGHGQPGEVLSLKLRWLNAWVRRHSHEDVRNLYDLFASDDEAAIHAKTLEIVEEVAGYEE